MTNEKFKKLGLYAIAAVMSATALFQLGSFISNETYKINHEQYVETDTVKYGTIEQYKIDSLLRGIDKQIASEEKWDSIPSESMAEIKKLKQLIKSDEFQEYVKNETFYRAALLEVNHGMTFDIQNFTLEKYTKAVSEDLKANPAYNAENIPLDMLGEKTVYNKKVNLETIKESSADKFVNQIDDMSTVQSKIEKIRTDNKTTTYNTFPNPNKS